MLGVEPVARGGQIQLTELDGSPKDVVVGIHQLQLEQVSHRHGKSALI